MMCFCKQKTILSEKDRIPSGILDFLEKNRFSEIDILWNNLFEDTLSFIRYYDHLVRKYPNKKLIPFALAVDPSGVFNDGYVIVSAFEFNIKDQERIFIYDANKEYSSLHNTGDFSFYLNSFSEWVNFAKKLKDEYLSLKDNNE
ncbi:hypothetical protein A4G19_02645 [Pasteurellaceae bacterium Macca]|nr:hypothetical protein [Pasteurellaceae bacterium Macca]